MAIKDEDIMKIISETFSAARGDETPKTRLVESAYVLQPKSLLIVLELFPF